MPTRVDRRPIFQHLQPHVLPPGIIQLSDLQLFEGLADFYGDRVDVLEIIGGWRHEAAKSGQPLQLFVLSRGFQQLALSRHILRSSKALEEIIARR